MSLHLEVVFDFCGDWQYYSGHGHASEDRDLLACVRFGTYIDYSETVGEIINLILEDINSRGDPIEFLNEAEHSSELQYQIEELLSDENITKAILAQLEDGVKLSDRFFTVDPEQLEEVEDEIYPMLIGYIHVRRDADE